MGSIKNFLAAILLLNSLVLFGQAHYTVKRVNFSLDEYYEFSPFMKGDTMVFCSNKVDGLFPKYISSNKKGYFSIFAVSLKDTTSSLRPELFSCNIITPYNDGPITFDKKGSKAVFSRNLNIEENKLDLFDPKNSLGLFTAELADGEWKNILPFRYNSDKFSNTTPFLSTDGTHLYFASDRPGGYGGSDLYMSEFINGTWTEPQNLGGLVNTKGNEISPFVSNSGELFFASDGHPGLGKKDIFVTLKEEDGKWITPVNLKPPINSKSDDISLITNDDFRSGFFASDRYRSDDIFHFETLVPQLYNCDTLRQNQYCIEFWDENYPGLDTLPVIYEWEFGDGSREKGLKVEHCFPKAGTYKVNLNIIDNNTSNVFFTQSSMDVEVKDYEQPYITSHDACLINEEIKFNGLASNLPAFGIEEYIWDFGDGKITTGPDVSHTYIKAGVYGVKLGISGYRKADKSKGKKCVIKLVTIVPDNQTLVRYLSGKKSSPGSLGSDVTKFNQDFSVFDLDPDKEVFRVEVLSSDKKIMLKDKIFDPLREKYEIKEFYLKDESQYSYAVGESTTLTGTFDIYTDVVDRGFTKARVKTYVLAELPTDIVARINRDFAELSDANFDFNQFAVSPTSYVLLDRIVKIMVENPDLAMEISAHTDDIGSFEYNMQLSQSRAQSIVDYLLSKGIDKQRLVAKGYGESRPVAPNNTEEGRMKNRRVEFTILNNKND